MAATVITIVSGGMGTSGEQLVRTAVAQFPDAEVRVDVVPRVADLDQLRAVVSKTAAGHGVIVHTLVDAGLRESLEALAREHGAGTLDVIGPLLERLAALLGQRPVGTPGLYRKLREDYFRRIEAIEYAVAHDDGRNPHELHQADIVLIGVSRVGKTPLSMYLAMKGWKTANVALVDGLPVPPELDQLDRQKVVGLMVEPEQLLAHRRRRQRDLGVAESLGYADVRGVTGEVEFARRVFRRGRFEVVDVTNKPIEESANEVLAATGR